MHKEIVEYNGYRIGDLVEIIVCDVNTIINYHMRGKNAMRIYRNTGMNKFQIEGWYINSFGQVVGVYLKYVYYHKNSSLKYKLQPFYFHQIKFADRLEEGETLWDYYNKHKAEFEKIKPKMINFEQEEQSDIAL